MSNTAQVRQALKGFIAANSRNGSMLLKVQTVNEAQNTCTLVDDEDESIVYYDARLRPVVDGNEAVTVVPKIGSWVIVETIENGTELLIVSVGEADKIKLQTAATLIEVNNTGIKISKGETLGEILSDLVTAIIATTHNVTAVGAPTGPPINAATFSAINSRLNAVLL
jgi:hypothetical protein